jgi:hypothetical protein
MDPLSMAALGSVGGSILGNLFGGGDGEEEALRRALEAIQGANWEAGPSAYGTDQDYGAALAAMRNEAQSGGMSTADRMTQEAAANAAARQARGQQGALMQNFAARGQGGGGAELAARMQANQNLTEAQHGYAAQQAGEAQRRALQALQGWGGMAGQRAGAADAISRFNASQRGAKAQATAGVYGQQAGAAAAQDQRTRDMFGGGGAAAGYLAGDYFFPNKKKEDDRAAIPEWPREQ